MKSFFIRFIVLAALLGACVYDYPVPQLKEDAQLLVVDGFLNASTGNVTVKLSRTTNLQSTTSFVPENNAAVALEWEFGKISLYQINEGYYTSSAPVSIGETCRITIQLASGKKYHSDWVEAMPTSPIDSLTYSTSNLGLQLEVSSHNPEKKGSYYMWQYVETWEYTSAFASDYILQDGRAVFRPENIYNCWHVKPSSTILVFSTKSLAEDVVSKFPVTILPKGSEKLAIKYSMLVQQMTIDQKAYDYWNLLKKNTENLGSLFDPQPSQLLGNIHNSQTNDELVLGYFFASAVSEERFTISLFDLPPDFRLARNFGDCELKSIPVRELGTFTPTAYNLVTPVPAPGPVPTDFYYSTLNCTDCRLQGGTTLRPYYW